MGASKTTEPPTIARFAARPVRVVLAAVAFAVIAAVLPAWAIAADASASSSSTVATASAFAAVAFTAGDTPKVALQMVDLSPEQAELVTHAVGLFAESGLVLPPLVVHGHADRAECGDHVGMHHPHTGWSEIDLCGGNPQSPAIVHVVLHEMAHAWAANALTDERRAAFQQLRGFEFWRNYEQAAWEDNGTEQAAEIVAWGVNDRSAATVRIDHVSCGELHAGYVALTGLEPVHGVTTMCAGHVRAERS